MDMAGRRISFFLSGKNVWQISSRLPLRMLRVRSAAIQRLQAKA
jgi:hypothetical protein